MSGTNNTALAVLEELRGNTSLAVGDAMFNDLAGPQNTYTSRLQLFSYNSGPVQDKKIEAGSFGIVNGDSIIDLTSEVVVVPVGVRVKAMDLNGDKPVVAFNAEGELFQSIRGRSSDKDSKCMCGVEFLVYIPDKDQFTTFYLANKTLLREAGNVKANLGYPIRCRSKSITKDKLRWHGMSVAAYPSEVALPSGDRIKAEISMFTNVQDTVPEEAAA